MRISSASNCDSLPGMELEESLTLKSFELSSAGGSGSVKN